MNCNEAATLVAAYADGEVDGLRGDLLKKHLLGCASCATQYQSVLALRAQLRAEIPYFPASPALRARVHAVLGAMRAALPSRPRPAHYRSRWLTGRALAGRAGTIL